MFRRDQQFAAPAGIIIAEFTCGSDALHFARAKGHRYTVTAGLNHTFAVRTALPTISDNCDLPPTVGPAPASDCHFRQSTESAGAEFSDPQSVNGCARCMRVNCVCSALDFEPEEL